MISATDNAENNAEADNVHSSLIPHHTIQYLHAAMGFPVKETWLDAIKAGNYVTWHRGATTAVRKHFPDSEETQQGHMKKQRQGVRSTKQLVEDEQRTIPNAKKMHNVYIKIHNVMETMHTDQPFSCYIIKRKPIHHGISRSGWQLHRCRTHEE